MRTLILFCLLSGSLFSCSKLLDVGEPPEKIVPEKVYSSDSMAAAVMAGIYYRMSNEGFATGSKGISVFCGLYADELSLFEGNQSLLPYYENTLLAEENTFWSPLYKYIQECNALLEGLREANGLTPAVKAQLMGEALFIRAFCYFYLVNLFGDVPLLTTTNLTTNTTTPRTPEEEVYEQIMNDLSEARNLLSNNYMAGDAGTPVNERLRPNKGAATALLARVYLYKENWVAAEREAGKVIQQVSRYSIPPSVSEVFLKDSEEVIWALESANTQGVNADAELLVLLNGPDIDRQPVYAADRLLSSFEPGDQRLTSWIGIDTTLGTPYYYPFKYQLATNGPSLTPYLIVLRLAEVYLIRAEAKAYMGDFAGARADLNILRRRVGLGFASARTREALLAAIEQERRVELFCEWGHRWLDLKRRNKADIIMPMVASDKGVSWQAYKKLFPIPLNDIMLNRALVQNPGY